MESCIAYITKWMHSDKLTLNLDKTESFLIGTRQQLQKVSNISTLSVWDSQIAPSCEVRNLGTWFDSNRSVTESLVYAFITSRIDYCNSLPSVIHIT